MMKYVCLILSILAGLTHSKKRGLYVEERDNVIVLNTDNFYDRILNKNHGWIIQFYSSWCGHCHNFAPTFKKIVNDVFINNDLIKAAVIDCANEKNTPICRQLDVEAYPTIRLFPANLGKGTKGEDVFPTKNKAAMLERILTKLQASFPELLRNGSFSLNPVDIIKPSTGMPLISEHYNLLFFEPSVKYSEKVKQYFSSLEKVKLLIVNDAKSPLISKHQVKKFPSLLYFKNKSAIPIDITPQSQDFESLYKVILSLEYPDTVKRLSMNNVYIVDLERSLDYTIHHEVYRHKLVKGTALEALKSFIEINYEYNPVGMSLKLYLKEMLKWLSNKREIETEELLNHMKAIENNKINIPKHDKWMSCQGSLPIFRGYPCSLWTSFHVMLTNAYLMKKEESYQNKRIVKSIHGYIKYFFSCAECSKNFQNMYNSSVGEASSAKESIIWLWRSHNKVNKRLSGEPSDDPLHQKHQFPSSSLCPECKDGHEAAIFQFLLDYYNPRNLRHEILEGFESTSESSQITGEGISLSNGTKSIVGFKLSNMDIGMAFLMYLISGIVLILVYYYYIVKTRKKRFFYGNSSFLRTFF